MKERSIISEAFMALDALNESEDIFNVDEEGVQEIKDFLADDEEDDTVTVFDDEANSEEELEDSYVGKVIVDCCVCHSLIYKNPEEVVIDEETDTANVDEECPYCHSTGDGYKVVGEVAPYNPIDNDNVQVEVEKIEDDDDSDDDDKDDDKEEKDKEDKDDKKEKKESFKRPIKRRLTESRASVRNKRSLIESKRRKFRESKVNNNGLSNSLISNIKAINGASTVKDVQKIVESCLPKSATNNAVAKKMFGKISDSKELAEALKAVYSAILSDKNMSAENRKRYESMARRVIRRKIQEAFDDVQISTDTEKITIKSEPKDSVEGDEMVAPVSPEIKDDILTRSTEEINDEEEVFPPEEDLEGGLPNEREEDIEEFDEDNFNEIGESFLKKTYDNVKSFKTSAVSEGKNNSIVVEGIVEFNSGNKKKTTFQFRGDKVLPSGRHRLVGENMDICGAKKAFHINGKIVNKKFISESLNYNYTVGGKRVSGSVRAKKNCKKK